MSDANRTAVGIVREVTLGTTPATPAFIPLRIKGADLSYSQNKVTSDELRADRQTTDLVLVGAEAQGTIPMEQSYGAQDELLVGLMFSDWVNAPYRYNNGSADSAITDVSATVLTFGAAGGNRTGQGSFAIGHMVRTTGFTIPGNNGLFRLTGATATTATTTGLSIEASPPGTARMKVVGVRAGAAAEWSSNAGTNVITRASGTVDFAAVGLVPGMWVKASGWTGAATANNGWYRLSAVATALLTFDVVPTGFVTDAGTGMTITLWFGDYIRNGVTKTSYTVEEQFQDLASPEFQYLTGMVPSTGEFSFDGQAIAQCAFAFLGTSASIGTARFAGATDKSVDYYGALPPTHDVYNTSAHVGRIAENGAAIAGPNYVTSASLSINNNLRRRTAVGSVGSVDIAAGRCIVTGKLSIYYGSKLVLDRIRNNTASSWDLRLIDATGTKGLVVDCPRIKLNSGDPSVSGVDTDRMIEPEFQALRHPTLGYTVQFQRIEEFA